MFNFQFSKCFICYLDVRVRGASHVEGGKLCALDGRNVQGLCVEVILELLNSRRVKTREVANLKNCFWFETATTGLVTHTHTVSVDRLLDLFLRPECSVHGKWNKNEPLIKMLSYWTSRKQRCISLFFVRSLRCIEWPIVCRSTVSRLQHTSLDDIDKG